MEIYLNGNLLTIADLQNEVIESAPKIHKIVSSKSLMLNVPEKSIGFFVVRNTNLAACSEKEKHNNLVEETSHHFDSDTAPEATNIDKEEVIVSAMNELYKMLKEEMSSSEDYNKFNNEDNSNKRSSNTENLSDNVRKIILQRAKQLSHEKTEHKASKFHHLLMEHAQKEQRRAKLLDEMEKNKASTDVEQAIDDVINKKADEIKSRRKRQTMEYLREETGNGGFMPTTDIDKIEARILLDSVVNDKNSGEQSCLCKNKGECICGLKNTNEIMHGILNIFNKQNIFQKKNTSSNENKPDIKKKVLDDFIKITSFVNNIKEMFLSGKLDNKHPENIKKTDIKPTSIQSVEPAIIISNVIPQMDADVEDSNEIMEKITLREISPNIDTELNQKYLKDLENDQIKNSLPTMRLIEETKNMDVYEKRRMLKEQLETYENMEKRLVHQLQKARNDIMNIQTELRDTPSKHLTKRSFWDFVDSDNTEEEPTTKYMDKNSLESDDQTKELDTFMNEISKETNKFVQGIEQDIYKIKPILLTTKSNPSTKETDSFTWPNTGSPEIWSESTTNIPGSSNSYDDSDDISDADETGLVDNVFKKLMSFLSSCHKKIISYMQLIAS